MYIFALATVIITAASVCALAYFINANQIDSYYKRLTSNSAKTFSHYVDIEYCKELREVVESEEYQALRDQAEANADEDLLIAYLQEKGLWEKYEEQRQEMRTFVNNMTDVQYLYIIAMGDIDSDSDMYLLDSDEVPVYETGYYELREEGFDGVDMQGVVQPTISDGDWGWLCSAYVPLYDADGELVCHVGCDISMEEVYNERRLNLSFMISSALICMLIFFILASIFVRKTIVNPMKTLSREMKRFTPAENRGYEESGVIEIDDINSVELGEIYEDIRSQQISIVDYINSINEIQRDKERAEYDAKNKEKVIDEISLEAFKDSLTSVGNKNAYNKRIKEIEKKLSEGDYEFAIVMVDVNGLKKINDNHGHSCGDIYLQGCCHFICEVFKRSPVFRIGGDEFVAILHGEDYDDRDEKVRELRMEFENSFRNIDTPDWLKYSAAVGVAINDQEGDTVETVFKRADDNMYAEKTKFKKENA